MILKITGNGASKSWTIHPGFGVALGKWHNFKDAHISRMAQNLDNLFEDNIICQKAWALCLTGGTKMPGSWLNSLNAKKSFTQSYWSIK